MQLAIPDSTVRRMRSTREYMSLMKFQNDCYRVDVMNVGVLTANGTKMKDAVGDASEHPKESGVRLASKLDAEMTNRRGTRMQNSIRLGSPVSPRLPSNENEYVNCVRDFRYRQPTVCDGQIQSIRSIINF